MDVDLTPTFSIAPAEVEVSLPPPATTAGSQPIGGFMATPTAFTNGNITLNGAGEQILVGSATAPLTGAGVFVGNAGDGTYDFRAGDPAGNYIHYDASAATLTVVGSITVTAGGTVGGFNVGSDYIRDAANTFGLASTATAGNDVRFWSGAAFASRATAPARIYEDGSAVFSNVQVGGSTIQYTMNNQGIYTFGDGSDGAVTFDGTTDYNSFSTHSGANYYLTRDVFASSITISNNVFVYTQNYRIFCQDTFTLVGGGQLLNDGADASGSTGGAATAAGYFPANIAGVNGGAGGPGFHNGGSGGAGNNGSAGTNGSNVANSIGNNIGTVAGARGGDGGAANAFAGGTRGAASTGGTRTARNIAPVLLFHFTTMFDINADSTLSKYRGAAGNGSGSGGGGGAAASFQETGGNGGNGGGSGAAGGIIYIAARHLIINASSNIFARGGKGGDGANGAAGSSIGSGQVGGGGGGGGGAGGQGGVVFLIYNTVVNSGTITITGGAGGAAGTGHAGLNGGGTGADGSSGGIGSDGITIQIQMAL